MYYDFSELQTVIDANSDKTLVLNFWATTCGPCIKEMPHFNTLLQSSDEADLNILLVSLDRATELDSKVQPFVERFQIAPDVAILEDQNYSAWTEKIDTSWYGALPATLIIKGGKRSFRFGAYESYEELLQDVRK